MLVRGSTNLATHPNIAACLQDIRTRVITASTSYQCREAVTAVPIAAPAPPPPPPPPPAQPTVTLSASPTTVTAGSASTLNWSTANASDCIASGGWSGAHATSGSEPTAALTVATAYTLTCNGTGGSASSSTTVSVVASGGSTQYGLEWPGTGAVRRMLYWSNPLPIYDATYIFRVLPKGPKTTGSGYWTTFFWGNNGRFDWDSGSANTYYGGHPYPFSGGQNWEVSAYGNDYAANTTMQWNRWYTQAFVAYKDVANNRHCHDFYYDLPDTNKLIRRCTWGNDPTWAKRTPPSPAIVMGQAPNYNGNSWGGYPGWEEFKGVIRGLQFYSGLLSVSDILSEVDATAVHGQRQRESVVRQPEPAAERHHRQEARRHSAQPGVGRHHGAGMGAVTVTSADMDFSPHRRHVRRRRSRPRPRGQSLRREPKAPFFSGFAEERIPRLIALGAVHRSIRVLEQHGTRFPIGGGCHHANARTHDEPPLADLHRSRHVVEQLAGQVRELLPVQQVGQQAGELVTSQTAHDVLDAQRCAQPRGNDLEQLVAGVVAVPIVDRLQAIQVDVQHRQPWMRRFDLGQCPIESLVKAAAVRQAGQTVMQGEMASTPLTVARIVEFGPGSRERGLHIGKFVFEAPASAKLFGQCRLQQVQIVRTLKHIRVDAVRRTAPMRHAVAASYADDRAHPRLDATQQHLPITHRDRR